MVGMIYLALKQFKRNPDVWSPSLPISEGSIVSATGTKRRFHAPTAAPRSWLFPSVLLASLLLRAVLVFRKFGTYDGLSQHEDEMI